MTLSGSGTEGDPYQVWTASDLDEVRNYPSAYFLQKANIDLSEYANWEPIGAWGSPFTGNYDGGNFTISNLTIFRSTSSYIGLFGYTNNPVFNNIHLTSINVTGNWLVGGLVGYNRYNISINNCSVYGSVEDLYDGEVGLLAGRLERYSSGYTTTVSNCFSEGTVKGIYALGGLIGRLWNDATINQCFSKANVIYTSSSTYYGYFGGLIGQIASTTIKNCYATGSVYGCEQVGGLIGYASSVIVENCYSIGSVSGNGEYDIRGLIGYKSGTVTNCYYNSETSGQSDTGNGEPRTTAQMTYPYASHIDGTYVDWDFSTVWAHDTSGTINNRYPYLLWYAPAPRFRRLTYKVPYKDESNNIYYAIVRPVRPTS
ncbi:MAG: GLUG motif-containing protein [Candidatus Aenigmarchaeota archaeon]|nr:GLUG motif-containing protein [Candidatus Aenigmarchaeota archaeon]